MKTNIPSSALPVNLSDPNKLSTTYTTNILYPKLGPVAVNSYVKAAALLLRDLASATLLIEKVKDYSKAYNASVSIIPKPEHWLRENVVFRPVLETGDIYSKVFIAGLSSFNETSVKEDGIKVDGERNVSGHTTREFSGDLNVLTTTIGTGRMSRRSGPSIIAVGDGASTVRAITDLDSGEFKLINGRVSKLELSPIELITDKSSLLNEQNINADSVKINSEELLKVIDHQKKAYMLGNIMHGLSQPNVVVSDLVDARFISVEGNLVKDTVLASENITTLVITSLQTRNNISDSRIEETGRLIDQGLELLERSGIGNNSFVMLYKKDTELRNQVKKYCINKFDLADLFGSKGLPSPVQPIQNHLREWAFQRIERLDITMGVPELRGPFNAESVSPNSELNISESFLNEQFDFTERSEGRAEQQSSERAVFTSSRFQSALSNMTESGISDENSFTTDATLLNTLREQRRAAIDRTLTNISTENESRTISGSRRVNTSSRTYITRGKDAKLATTELAFHVAAKVDVEVRLQDVDLVWAPYIYSPFLYLHQIIRNYKQTSIFEYIEQNIIVDPARPFEEYQVGTFKKELAISGSQTSQSKNFDFPIPAQYLGAGWELDKENSTIAFRNGVFGDYNWDERPNWDDLENWDVYFKTLRLEGDRVKGEATLETTDPEWLNKGFLVFNFQMRRLSDRSRAELRAYALEQASVEAERRAVQSRARQYGELKKVELIEHYAQSLDLREEAFTALIEKVFIGTPPQNLSYYKEIIRSCINWNNVAMHLDSNRSNNLPFAEYSRSHFMNAPGVRFILPIIGSAEDVFFNTISQNGNTYYQSAITEVQVFTKAYRQRIEDLEADSPGELVLDKYSRDIILGRHLEAVLSNHPFAE